MTTAVAGVPFEIDLGPSAGAESDTSVSVEFRSEVGPAIIVPAFRGADGQLRVRFCASAPGKYEYVVSPGDDVRAPAGSLDVATYDGDHRLYRHGRLQRSADGGYLEHADGTPFLWIGDTWWMGLTPRLDWPHGFRHLLDDRVAKGFNVVQMVVGPLPDFAATRDGIWHEQQANEGGWSWEPDWAGLNPAYFDAADRRIAALVEAGIVPCIVAMWGFYGTIIGRERAERHWRELIARYAAYPVVFCVAGEFDYPGYDSDTGPEARASRRDAQIEMWSRLVDVVHQLDPYANPVTMHRGYGSSRARVADPDSLDLDMLQTSHWGYHQPPDELRVGVAESLGVPTAPAFGFEDMLAIYELAVSTDPPRPVVNAEPPYEGILGGNWEDVQRFDYWTGMLAGLAGVTYGADGIWQMSSSDQSFANSVSKWGSTSWQEAMHHSGSGQVGAARGLLEQIEWWTLRPVDSRRARAAGRVAPIGLASDRTSVYYFPSLLIDQRLVGMRDLPLDLPGGGPWHARYVDPRTMDEHPIALVEADDQGRWIPPERPTMADWVLVIEHTTDP